MIHKNRMVKLLRDNNFSPGWNPEKWVHDSDRTDKGEMPLENAFYYMVKKYMPWEEVKKEFSNDEILFIQKYRL